uniref:Uncharacterized protein n=1 Tax=Manihot esculenta TaxID=3983 RepID=A0A2C9VBU9_MANES
MFFMFPYSIRGYIMGNLTVSALVWTIWWCFKKILSCV